MSEYIAPRSRARIFMNWLAGALVALLVVGGFSTPAMAAGGKVTVFPASSSGEEHNGTPVMPGGETFSFQLGYGSMDDGAVSTITLPEGVTIPKEALVVPAGNTAVESLEINADGQLVITFAKKFPSDVSQGVLDLKFTLDTVEHSEVRELNWDVDGVPTSQQIIVTKPETSRAPRKRALRSASTTQTSSTPSSTAKSSSTRPFSERRLNTPSRCGARMPATSL